MRRGHLRAWALAAAPVPELAVAFHPRHIYGSATRRPLGAISLTTAIYLATAILVIGARFSGWLARGALPCLSRRYL